MRLALGSRDPAASGMRTRFATIRVPLPTPEADFDQYADAVVQVARDHPCDAVLLSIDASVAVLHRRRTELGRLTAPAIGSAAAVEIAISKPRTLELANNLGVETPRSLRAVNPEDVDAAARELGLPVVVKPNESWRDVGRGGERLAPALVSTELELRAARKLAPALVQELVPGRRETIKLFRTGGRFIARFAMRIDRTWPPLGGSSVLRESVPLPADALERAERLVSAIDLEGYSEVEFRRSANGTPLLMEINPRLSQSVELPARAGIDFGRMQLEWARGGTVPVPNGYRTGVRLVWLAGDARLLAAAVLGRGPSPRPTAGAVVRSIARDYGTKRTRIEGLDIDDLRPVGAALAFAVRNIRPR